MLDSNPHYERQGRKPLWNLALRFVRSDLRSAEVFVLALALIVSVAASSTVGLFIERLQLAMTQDANSLIGGDLVIVADQEPDPAWIERARSAGLSVAQTLVFPSMVSNPNASGDQPVSTLVALKAVESNYPLRGSLKLANPERVVSGGPGLGFLWVDQALLHTLGLSSGATLQLGERTFKVADVIAHEPDRGGQMLNIAPRAMMDIRDLAGTGLLGPGSRVTWRVLFAGDKAKVDRFRESLGTLPRGFRLEDTEQGRPEIKNTLDRAQRFLSLASICTALVSALAVLLAARRFTLHRLDAYAVLRCLGATQGQLTGILLFEFLLIGVACVAMGGLLGYVGQAALIQLLSMSAGPFSALNFPSGTFTPLGLSMLSGLLVLLGVVAPYLHGLRTVPALRVLRRDVPLRSLSAVGRVLPPVVGVLVSAWFAAGDVRTAVIFIAGFALVVLGFAIWALGVAWLLGRLRRVSARYTGGLSLKMALTSMARRRVAFVIQMASLALGLTLLLLLTLVRGDLLDSWRSAAPADAPNRFVVNLMTDQVEPFSQALASYGVKPAVIWPMIRGRLVAVNERPVGPDDFAAERAKRLVDREFNLSYTDHLPGHNAIELGQWFAEGGQGAEVSVESGVMSTLGLQLGDRLRFDIAGKIIEVRITSVRRLRWDSMQVNFFMLMPTHVLAPEPKTWVTSFHADKSVAPRLGALLRTFPNITLIDTEAVLAQVQQVIERVVWALEALFSLTLVAGVLVLSAGLIDSRDERAHEAVLLRALGATGRQLRRAAQVELLLLGAVAGAMASVAALALGASVSHWVLEIPFTPNLVLTLSVGMAVGAVSAYTGGVVLLMRMLGRPALTVLREY